MSGDVLVAAIVLGAAGLMLQDQLKRARARGDNMKKEWVQVVITAVLICGIVYAIGYHNW